MAFVVSRPIFGFYLPLPLQAMVHGCWQQTEDKCDWLNGRAQPRPLEQLQHRLGAALSVWTQCSANTLTMITVFQQKCIFS